MVQQIIIWVLFVAALVYVGYLFYQSFFSKKAGCGGGCGCSAVDLERIERQIKESIGDRKTE